MKFFKDYSLTIALTALFLISWLLQGIFQWQHEMSQAQQHGQQLQVSDFANSFLTSTFENWQSEFLQLFTFATLSTYLIHKDSPQSRDGDDEIKKLLMRIDRKLNEK
jgi:hypothetical protein